MSQVLNIVLVGGLLVVGFVMVQSYQATGNPFSFIPTPAYAQGLNDDIEDDYSNIECNSDNDRCRWCSSGTTSSCVSGHFCGPWVDRKSGDDDDDIADDARDEFIDKSNANRKKCGITGTSTKVPTTVVQKKQSTSKQISPIGKGTPKVVVTGSKKTSKGDPTSTGITGTSCSLKYRTMCHVRYYSNGKPFCYCPALSGKAGFRQSNSRHVSIYSHSHDRLNIPRAFIGKKRKSANNVRINAF